MSKPCQKTETIWLDFASGKQENMFLFVSLFISLFRNVFMASLALRQIKNPAIYFYNQEQYFQLLFYPR